MEYIAERRLLVAKKGSCSRNELIIKVSSPYIVQEGTVNFPIDEETSGCDVEIIGLDKPFHETTYGADLLQALQLAADIDPTLERFTKDYDFYFTTGEPYFE